MSYMPHFHQQRKALRTPSRIVAFLLIVALVLSGMGVTTQGILDKIKLGLDLQGGFEVLYEVETLNGKPTTEKVLSSTTTALDDRINVFGVSEPSIQALRARAGCRSFQAPPLPLPWPLPASSSGCSARTAPDTTSATF